MPKRAGAVSADDAEDVPLLDGEADVAQDPDVLALAVLVVHSNARRLASLSVLEESSQVIRGTECRPPRPDRSESRGRVGGDLLPSLVGETPLEQLDQHAAHS